MNPNDIRVAAVVLFVVIVVFGIWLSSTGRPPNVVLLTIHKLAGVAALVLLIYTAYQTNRALPLSGLEIAVVAVSAAAFIATIITGGLVSTELQLPAMVLTLHRVLPVLTLISSGGALVMLLNSTRPPLGG